MHTLTVTHTHTRTVRPTVMDSEGVMVTGFSSTVRPEMTLSRKVRGERVREGGGRGIVVER